MKDLRTLLNSLDPEADLARRHVWLIQLFEWIRGDESSVQACASRLQTFIGTVETQPELEARLKAWWQTLVQTVEVTTLLADFGFAPRTAFFSELAERLRRKLLPGTPETIDTSELFPLVAPSRFDAQWMAALQETQVNQLALLLSTDLHADRLRWQLCLMDALTYCTAQIRATGFSPELRLRMDRANDDDRAFHGLSGDVDAFRTAFFGPVRDEAALQAAIDQYRTRLDTCRQAVNGVYDHLDKNGISVGMVFLLRQMRERIVRVRELLDALVSPVPAMAALKLLARRVTIGQDSKSIGALISANSTLLSAKMAERSAETGEHYITRDRGEYREMLGKAMGGGAITAFTTLLKFMVVAVGLSAFWSGFWAGVMYAGSFIVIQLLHLTLATKQPAMTAPAMAASLPAMGVGSDEAIQDFVDRVAQLIRSQVAGIAGNIALCAPLVWLVQWLSVQWLGAPLIGELAADHVLGSITLLGPTALFAAFTGVLLFASSLVAGWAENWFVLHRLDSAIAWNPRILAVLGPARARFWAGWWRANISGVAANVSLGMMLGLVPALLGFIGLGLDVRHVTLASGQLAAALGALGFDIVRTPAFWWCVAGIAVTAVLNLSVSFGLAFSVALRSRGVRLKEQSRILAALRRRLLGQPLSFLFPPRD